MKVHLPSLLLGAGSLFALGALLSAQVSTSTGAPVVSVLNVKRPVQTRPVADDWVRIDEETPYTVPPGNVLHLTCFGATGLGQIDNPENCSTGPFGKVYLRLDHQDALKHDTKSATGPIKELPRGGLILQPGTIVEVRDSWEATLGCGESLPVEQDNLSACFAVGYLDELNP